MAETGNANEAVILGGQTAAREARSFEQRTDTKLRKAGFDPERVQVVPREVRKGPGIVAPEPRSVLAKEPAAAPAKSEPARGEDGKFLAKPDGAGQDEGTKGEQTSDPAAKTAEATEVEAGEAKAGKALKDARKALELAGYDEGDLDGLPEEKILALGRKAAARNAEIGKRLEQATKAATKPTAPAKAAEATPEVDPTDDLIAQAAKGFSEKYDGEFGQEIGDFGKKLVAAVRAAGEQRLTAYEAKVEAVLLKDAVSTLRERFPQVDQPGGASALKAEMDRLADVTETDDHLVLARKAAVSLWGEAAIEAAEAHARAKSESKQNGQPLSAKRDAQPKPKSAGDVFQARLEAAARGASGDELRAIR